MKTPEELIKLCNKKLNTWNERSLITIEKKKFSVADIEEICFLADAAMEYGSLSSAGLCCYNPDVREVLIKYNIKF